MQVWDAVAQRVPERARWIEVLGVSLEEAEEKRRVVVEGQLVTMVRYDDAQHSLQFNTHTCFHKEENGGGGSAGHHGEI